MGDFHYLVFCVTDPFFCILQLLLIPCSVFFISIIVSFSFVWFFFNVFYLFIEVFTVFILLLSSVTILMATTLNYLPIRMLIFVSLSTFSGISSCSFIWNMCISLSQFSLSLCVCFYIFSKLAMSLRIKIAVLYRRCPVKPNGTILACYQRWVLQRCSLGGLYALSSCGWATVVVIKLLGRVVHSLAVCKAWL